MLNTEPYGQASMPPNWAQSEQNCWACRCSKLYLNNRFRLFHVSFVSEVWAVLFRATGKLNSIKCNWLSENTNVWYKAVTYWMLTEFFNDAAVKELLQCQCITPNDANLNWWNSIKYNSATHDSAHTWFELKQDMSWHQTRLSTSPELTYSVATVQVTENILSLSGNTLNKWKKITIFNAILLKYTVLVGEHFKHRIWRQLHCSSSSGL